MVLASVVQNACVLQVVLASVVRITYVLQAVLASVLRITCVLQRSCLESHFHVNRNDIDMKRRFCSKQEKTLWYL